MALGQGLGARNEFAEESLLHGKARLEALTVHRRLDAAHVVFRRQEAPGSPGNARPEFLEDFGLAPGRFELLVGFANLAQGAVLGENPLGEGDGRRLEIVLGGQFVHEPQLETCGSGHVLPPRHHFESLLDADDPGQALGAPGSRQESEIHLGQATTRRRHRHAVVAAERHFEPAPERRPMNRGDHGLARIFDGVLHRRKARALGGASELGDIRARDEGSPAADEDHGPDRGVGLGGLHPLEQAGSHGRGERVHRR